MRVGSWRGALTPSGLEYVAFGCAEDERRVRHPVVDPPTVGASEHALRRRAGRDPHVVEGGVGTFAALPPADGQPRARPGAARSRRAGPAGQLAGAQRGADPGRREERCGQARPGRVRRTAGPDAAGPSAAPVGHLEVGEHRRAAGHPGDRAAGEAACLPLQPGAGGDERVVGRSLGMAGVAVAGDRAMDQTAG